MNISYYVIFYAASYPISGTMYPFEEISCIFHQPLGPSQIKSHTQLGMSNYKSDCLIFPDVTQMVKPLLFIVSILHSPTFVSALFQGSLIVRKSELDVSKHWRSNKEL